MNDYLAVLGRTIRPSFNMFEAFVLILLIRSCWRFDMPEAIVYAAIVFVLGLYFSLQAWQEKDEASHPKLDEEEELKKDVEELKSKVNSIMLRDGFKIK